MEQQESALGDLRNKAKKEAEIQALADAERRRREGWTIFYFNFDPKRVRRNLSPGDALRYLCKVANIKIAWWHCPIRGWAIQYTRLPTSTKVYDFGETYKVLHFSRQPDELEAKKELCEDMLLNGVELYRGLPNKVFDEQVATIRWLLKAPPSVAAKDWLEVKAKLHRWIQPLLETHEADLRAYLLGQRSSGPVPVELNVRSRLEAGQSGRS